MGITIDTSRLGPSQMSELAVLAGVLRNNECIDGMTLTVDDFENPLWGDTFERMRTLRSHSKPITPISLGQIDQKHQTFYFEIDSEVSVGDALAPEFHANAVRQAAIRRRLGEAGAIVHQLCRDESEDAFALGDRARKLVDDAIGVQQAKLQLSDELAHEVVANIGRANHALPTPWRGLTRIIRGFAPGRLYVVGARPAIGKSSIALQMARALENYGYVLFFSLEMGREEVMQRLISQATQVPLSVIDGTSPMQDFMKVKIDDWLATYSGRIIIDDTPGLTMSDIRASVRSHARTHNLTGVVVDYLQLIGGMEKGMDLRVHTTNLSREHKLLAKEFAIPVIVLSQLNRNAEHRADKRPALADLRESGSIEQDADAVILLHRQEDLDILELIVAKNRQGPTMNTEVTWHGEFTMALE